MYVQKHYIWPILLSFPISSLIIQKKPTHRALILGLEVCWSGHFSLMLTKKLSLSLTQQLNMTCQVLQKLANFCKRLNYRYNSSQQHTTILTSNIQAYYDRCCPLSFISHIKAQFGNRYCVCLQMAYTYCTNFFIP